MKKIITASASIIILVFCIYCLCSCTSEENLGETLFVPHKNADMPAYIYGNGSEKIFLITLQGGPGGLGLGFRTKMFKE